MPRVFRKEKIGSTLAKEISRVITKDFEFDGALVTVLDVVVSDDLLRAKVKLGIIPYEKELEVWNALEKARRAIEHTLLKGTRFKPLPHLEFEIIQEQAKTE